jgi:flagellar motor switch protein FliG
MEQSAPKESILKKEIKPKQEEQNSKYRKVAKFLILIGEEEAARILAYLEPEYIETLSKEIVSIPGITAPEAAAIMQEFQGVFATSRQHAALSFGGVATARRILHRAFGAEKGETFLVKTLPEAADKPFSFLEEFSGEQLAPLLKDESPALQALVLARLPSKLSAAIISQIDPEKKPGVIKRLATLKETSPEVLSRIADVLRNKTQEIEKLEGTRVDGMSTLTAIIKSSSTSFGNQLLNDLAYEDPLLSRTLRQQLHTFEDIIKADDRPIEEKIRSMPDKDIVLLLKHKSPEFIEKIFSNMSAQRRKEIRDEEEILGPVRKSEADRVSDEFLAWFRENRESGAITLIDEDLLI